MVKKAAESENRKNRTKKKKKSFDGRSWKVAPSLLADNHLVEYHMADHQIFGQPPFAQPPFANHHLANIQLPTFIWLTITLADIIFKHSDCQSAVSQIVQQMRHLGKETINPKLIWLDLFGLNQSSIGQLTISAFRLSTYWLCLTNGCWPNDFRPNGTEPEKNIETLSIKFLPPA